MMEIIKDIDRVLKLFRELNSGGLESYDDENQALTFKFESNGGINEDYTLTIRFTFVEYFQLPLSLDACSINGYGVDEIRLISEEEARLVMPIICCERMDYRKNNYRCYRFYANEKASPFYIYCLTLDGGLEKYQQES